MPKFKTDFKSSYPAVVNEVDRCTFQSKATLKKEKKSYPKKNYYIFLIFLI